jgi:hypothetical protein
MPKFQGLLGPFTEFGTKRPRGPYSGQQKNEPRGHCETHASEPLVGLRLVFAWSLAAVIGWGILAAVAWGLVYGVHWLWSVAP